MANRLRNERLEIKLTKEEKALFEEKRKLAKCKNMNLFIRKCVLEKEIYQVDLDPFRDLQGLPGSATNNINQIAKRVNSTGVIYKEYHSDPSDKAFFEEYKAQITLYENALSELKKSYSKLPNSKDILNRLDNLQEKKNTLMKEYSSSKSTMYELYKIRKNYGIYMGKEMER